MPTDLEVALAAARAGAEVVGAGLATRGPVTMKGEVDPVTETDTAAERAAFAAIERQRPQDLLLGEESGGAAWDTGRVWIVDPLDGTVNFVHGIPHVAVSVGLWEDGKPVAAAIIDVTRGEEFTATAGGGTHLDGATVTVSDQTDLGQALVVTGFPYDRRQHADEYAAVVGAVLGEVQGIRRLGSAALDFAWVACGRFDAYWEYGLAPWDAAAGILLVTEAGGRVSDYAGDDYNLGSSSVVATNGLLHGDLADLVADHIPEHVR